MYLIIGIFYLILLILCLGLLKNKKFGNKIQRSFSIIISCRNEEKNLPRLFKALSEINYPADKFEIIIADDASSDYSPYLIKKFSSENSHVKSVILTEKNTDFKGKKAALKAAIEKSVFPYLLFTDADCSPSPDWLSSYNNYFNPQIDMVIGFSPEETSNKFYAFTQVLNAGLYAASVGIGFPFSCSGRNYCLRKKKYDEISGFSKFKNNVSGDDKMLLNEVVRTGGKVNYNPDSPVKTFKSENFTEQQKRRYGKFSQHRISYKILSLLLFIFFLYLPFYIAEYPSYLVFHFLFLSLFHLSNTKIHGLKFSFTDVLFFSLVPYYIIFFSIWGIASKWRWK
ncbi:MAG: hypothetical protein CSB55_04440 [Candidatus Cloacimonadota bacterium]|nr:MAG: hypothetical protein CSB55_04440 [Candidatus Cloacimonadota bacterium]